MTGLERANYDELLDRSAELEEQPCEVGGCKNEGAWKADFEAGSVSRPGPWMCEEHTELFLRALLPREEEP